MGMFVFRKPDGTPIEIKVDAKGEGYIINPGDPDWVGPDGPEEAEKDKEELTDGQ